MPPHADRVRMKKAMFPVKIFTTTFVLGLFVMSQHLGAHDLEVLSLQHEEYNTADASTSTVCNDVVLEGNVNEYSVAKEPQEVIKEIETLVKTIELYQMRLSDKKRGISQAAFRHLLKILLSAPVGFAADLGTSSATELFLHPWLFTELAVERYKAKKITLVEYYDVQRRIKDGVQAINRAVGSAAALGLFLALESIDAYCLKKSLHNDAVKIEELFTLLEQRSRELEKLGVSEHERAIDLLPEVTDVDEQEEPRKGLIGCIETLHALTSKSMVSSRGTLKSLGMTLAKTGGAITLSVLINYIFNKKFGGLIVDPTHLDQDNLYYFGMATCPTVSVLFYLLLNKLEKIYNGQQQSKQTVVATKQALQELQQHIKALKQAGLSSVVHNALAADCSQ